MSNKHAFPGGTILHKELQGFAAFVAYQETHQGGTSLTKALLEASVARQYFGDPSDPDSIGLAEQLVRGVGVFSSLYEPSATLLSPLPPQRNSVAPPGNSNRTLLVLKPSLHCLGRHAVIPVGGVNGISLPLMLQSKLTMATGDQIKARTLFTRAQEVAKNGKKALACVMAQDSPYKEYVRTGNLPSGMNHGDYLQFVREKMFVALNPSKEANASAEFGDIDDDSGKMSTFPGYIVFALMGPIVEEFDMLIYRSDLLMTTTPFYSSTAEKKVAGQQNCRKLSSVSKQKRSIEYDNAASNEAASVATLSTSEPETTGATLSECIQAAGIAQSRLADKGKKKAKVNDRIVSMYLKKVAGKQSMIQEQKYLIEAISSDDPNRHLYVQELRQLNLELAKAIKDLTKAEEKIIEDEASEASKIDSIGVMIDATIAGILLDNKKIETRVSPALPFVASYGGDNEDIGNDNEEDDGLMESPN